MTDIKLTKRQCEVLVNIYLGNTPFSQRTMNAMEARDRDEPIPPWGARSAFQRFSHMGGALARMKTRLGENGLLVAGRYSTYLHKQNYRDKLTALALECLREHYPTLPDIDKRLADQIAVEEASAAEALEQQRQARAAMREITRKERLERIDRMRAILRDYQVQHSLTDDQLREMWDRVVSEEMTKIGQSNDPAE